MDQNHLSDTFRVLGQEQLQSVKLLGDALDVIQSINANDEFDAVKPLPELLNPLLDGLFEEVLYAPPGVRRVSSHHEKERVFGISSTEAGSFCMGC